MLSRPKLKFKWRRLVFWAMLFGCLSLEASFLPTSPTLCQSPAPAPHPYSILSSLDSKNAKAVLRLSGEIRRVQPYLETPLYVGYAYAIHRAARRFGIDPRLLIAIAQQESSFRSGLPEGAAGEHGIWQVRRCWLVHPDFVKEFGAQSIADLRTPMKNVLFAAWILREIKQRRRPSSEEVLPYWTYYNAINSEARQRYFDRVSVTYDLLHGRRQRRRFLVRASPSFSVRPAAHIVPASHPRRVLQKSSVPGIDAF